MTSIPFPNLPDEDAAYEDQRAKEDWEEYEKNLRCEQAYFGLCWPDYCKKCGGWGVHHFTQNHGEPWLTEHLTDPCDCVLTAILLKGEEYCKCACCSNFGLNADGEGPCEFCGWNYDDGFPCY